jgi:hypothetical protein
MSTDCFLLKERYPHFEKTDYLCHGDGVPPDINRLSEG